MGYCCRRAPVASKKALAIAAGCAHHLLPGPGRGFLQALDHDRNHIRMLGEAQDRIATITPVRLLTSISATAAP